MSESGEEFDAAYWPNKEKPLSELVAEWFDHKGERSWSIPKAGEDAVRFKAIAEFVRAAEACAGISTQEDIDAYTAALNRLAIAIGVLRPKAGEAS